MCQQNRIFAFLKMKAHFASLIFLVTFQFSVGAQSTPLLDSLELEGAEVFYSLKEALVNPDKVYRLHLKGKGLSDIPEAVFGFKNLQELILARNKFTEIPSNVAKLENLQRLSFAKNKLKYVNAEVARLKNLKSLIISQNEIVELPKELATMEKLEFIDIWSNEIATVPAEFKQFKALKKMDFRVILLNDTQQDEIRKNLPANVDAMFSPSCNCGK